ncbi:hypothetical protein [Abyssalbus ytuae]|uniref:Uncharacterized protein n=1 Tax=Abyssalbus ytuae TaxID=2926907 RepID=A0A9E6ZLS2_9FLAO|nr:hypothetical protein [Abyssalbus ytuae]UOB16610.1 hypothetical protein MQE35_12795 [Abyssalbus ytuae]
MRDLNKINEDIERAQNQIAATWDNDKLTQKEKDETAEGFQLQLNRLLNEKKLHTQVHNATVVLPDGSEKQFGDKKTNDH